MMKWLLARSGHFRRWAYTVFAPISHLSFTFCCIFMQIFFVSVGYVKHFSTTVQAEKWSNCHIFLTLQPNLRRLFISQYIVDSTKSLHSTSLLLIKYFNFSMYKACCCHQGFWLALNLIKSRRQNLLKPGAKRFLV